MAGGVLDGDLGLLLGRQGEEALGLGIDLRHQRIRDAVMGDVEKADIAAGIANRPHGLCLGGIVPMPERPEIDHRNSGNGEFCADEGGSS